MSPPLTPLSPTDDVKKKKKKKTKKPKTKDASRRKDEVTKTDKDGVERGGDRVENDPPESHKEPEEDRFDTRNKPQFRGLSSSTSSKSKQQSSNTSKVVLDERFSSLLTDPRFQLDIRDRYGRSDRKHKKKGAAKDENGTVDVSREQLSAFYTVKEEEEEDDKDKDDQQTGIKTKDPINSDHHTLEKSSHESEDDSSEGGEDNIEKAKDQDPMSRIAYLTALSRGELDVSSSSSEDDDELDNVDDEDSENDDSDDSEGGDVLGKAGILDPSYHQENSDTIAPPPPHEELTMEPSRYLAVLNMDWSHVRAVDIWAVVSSFVDPGAVEKVEVYPSDFGMERIAQEDQFGPSNLWKKKKNKTQEPSATEQMNFSRDEDDEGMDSGDEDDHGDEEEEQQDIEEDSVNVEDRPLDDFLPQEDHVESDFDPEKLRAYEASRLKYYFAIVYFTTESHADVAYREVDGMELENSSATIDVRAIPPTELESVIDQRPLRDQATSLPSDYKPPDFVINALQQTNVKCTWEAGDTDRDRALTKYGSSGQDWKAMSENDDLKAYLASDVSSDDNAADEDDNLSNSDNEDENHKGTTNSKSKASLMRQMLGLDKGEGDGGGGSESDGDEGGNDFLVEDDDENDQSSEASNDFERAAAHNNDDKRDEDDEEDGKQVRYIPGSKEMADKIRSKVVSPKSQSLTPWEKYQERRKEKKKEKKKEAKAKREEINRMRRGGKDRNRSEMLEDGNDDTVEMSLDENKSTKRGKLRTEELELLVAGDDQDEVHRDYDMRGLQRIEKNKDKKLRGARKRKEAELASTVTGTDFRMDLTDNRFRAVLDGQDDRFGIDRTNPQFQDTPAMQEVLAEQTKRRRRDRQRSKRPKPTTTDMDTQAEEPRADKPSQNGIQQSSGMDESTPKDTPKNLPSSTSKSSSKKMKQKTRRKSKESDGTSDEAPTFQKDGAMALSALMSRFQSN